MPKTAKALTPLVIGRLATKPGRHAVGGITGLCLSVSSEGTAAWVMRAVIGDKRREIGLGGFPAVRVDEARQKAKEVRSLIDQGIDPVLLRMENRAKLAAERAAFINFEDCATKYISAHRSGWRNPKHAAQWQATLQTYAHPVIGKMAVKDIAIEHILKILEPIWAEKTTTANRLRGRIEQVLDWAAVRKFRSPENPARWKGYLDKVLPPPSKIAKVEHRKALPFEEMGAFMADLRKQGGYSALALQFAILTATRSGEVRGAKWSEIKGSEWQIPAERMKANTAHTVPLSKQALALLKSVPKVEGCDYIFPSRKNGPLSDMALVTVTRDMKAECVPHGFRSTFRDWAGDCTQFQREVIEHALAHKLPDKVEAAYRRSDALEKRRKLMQDWADFCDQKLSKGKVIPMKKVAK